MKDPEISMKEEAAQHLPWDSCPAKFASYRVSGLLVTEKHLLPGSMDAVDVLTFTQSLTL